MHAKSCAKYFEPSYDHAAESEPETIKNNEALSILKLLFIPNSSFLIHHSSFLILIRLSGIEPG